MRLADSDDRFLAKHGMSIKKDGITTKNNFLRYGSAIIPNIHGRVLMFTVPSHHQYFKVLVTSQSLAIER